MLPKMHFLEEHMVPWLRKWHIGFGVMGEQGAESIHSYFNTLCHNFKCIPEPVKRVTQVMKAHYLHIAPANVLARPPIKRRKKEEAEE